MEMQENQPFFCKKNSLFTLFSIFTAFSYFLCNKISLPVFAPKSPLSVPPSTCRVQHSLVIHRLIHIVIHHFIHICVDNSPLPPPTDLLGSALHLPIPPSESPQRPTLSLCTSPLPPNTEERENYRPTRSNLSTSLPEGESRPMETGSVSADQESIRYRPPPPQPCATCTHRIHFASLLHEKAIFFPQK